MMPTSSELDLCAFELIRVFCCYTLQIAISAAFFDVV